MSVFSWVGESARTPPSGNAVNFAFAPADPTKIKPVGQDTAAAGTIAGFTTFPRGTANVKFQLGVQEYVPKAVKVAYLVPSEYYPQTVTLPLTGAICETPDFWPTGVDTFTIANYEWPILFKSSELGVPKSITLGGVELNNLGELTYIGASVVYFGGCGFGAGDSFDVEPSYWEDEQAYIKSCLMFQGSDEYSSGEVRING